MHNCDVEFVNDVFISYLYSVEAMNKDKMSIDEYKEHRTNLLHTVKSFAASCKTKKIEGDYYIKV